MNNNRTKPVFILMVGLPGSGKSTQAEKLGYKIFSSDTYREIITGDVNNQTENDRVFRALYDDLKKCLMEGTSCILDATNICRKDRRRALEQVKGIDCYKQAFVVCPPYSTCKERNKSRERVVPEHVLEKMIRKFEFPQLFEGFDTITVHNEYNEGCKEYLLQMLSRMDGFNQDNPHHVHDLATHCQKVANQFSLNSVEYSAGLVHDIGKLVTKKFDDKGIAHYYNHDSLGTYILASNIEFQSQSSEVFDRQMYMLFLVNYHMRAHNDFSTAKAERKYRALFGDDWFNKLMIFAEADRTATGTYEGRKDVRPGIN